MSLRISQYAYFAVSSSNLSAADIGTRVGLAPDSAALRGHKRTNPPLPALHEWRISSPDATLPLDEQVERLVERLRMHGPSIGELVDRLREWDEHACSRLQVVRYLDDARGTVGGYQHPLLGWGLGSHVVHFLTQTRASLDVDEYDEGAD